MVLSYIIQTPLFITLHLDYQNTILNINNNTQYEYDDAPPKYLLFRSLYTDLLSVGYDDIQCEEYCKLEYHPCLPRDSLWFAQSFGLICVSAIFEEPPKYSPNIYLWNPLLQKCKTLPLSPLPKFKFGYGFGLYASRYGWNALAFGFLPQVNDYVVIHIVRPDALKNPNSVMIGVYSLNTNSWKVTSQDNVFTSNIVMDDVTFVNGAAFWVGFHSWSHPVVMCFDTKIDMLRKISLPDWICDLGEVNVNPTLHPFGQSIAYFVQNDITHRLDMWVLKGDPMNMTFLGRRS